MNVGEVVPENITNSGVVEEMMGFVMTAGLVLGATTLFGAIDRDEDPDWLLTAGDIDVSVPRIGVCPVGKG